MKWAYNLFFWLAVMSTSSYAQQNLIFQGEVGSGFIMQHSPAISHLVTTHPTSYLISVHKPTTGEKAWESRYNFPRVGATFMVIDYHNAILGKTIGIIPNYNFYLGNKENRINGFFKIGIGLSYHTNPYDRVENNKNNVTSTHMSFGVMANSGFEIKISEKLNFHTGISLIHFSNGSVKKPNKGANVISLAPGFSYTIGNQLKNNNYDTTSIKESKKWRFTSVLATGYNETIKIRSGSYPFFNFQLSMDKKVSFKSRIGLGIEYFHSLSLKEEIKNDRHLEDGEKPDFKRAAVFVGHELEAGRISVVKQLGWYIYKPYEVFEPFYVRAGLRYKITDHVLAGVTIKSHYFKAESAEWSIGYRF